MKKRRVMVLRGLPGSGKSTYAAGIEGAVVCSADDFYVRIGGGVYRHDPARIGEAHTECFRKFLTSLTEGRDTVVCDNTNSMAIEIAPYMLAAAAFGYEAEVIQFRCSPEEAAARNVHGVPEDVIRKMAEAMERTLPPWWTVRDAEVRSP